MTHYDILQVARDASPEVIEASWKALLKKFHPDKSRGNAEKAVLVNQAHDILSDPKMRKEYDAWLTAQNGNGHAPKSRVRTKPQPAYGAAYGEAYPAQRETEGLIENFIDKVSNGGPVDIEGLLVSANEMILRKLMERNPMLAAIIQNYGAKR